MFATLSQRSGQSMLIAVLAMGGAMLAATTIAGLLILYQLRASTNSVASSQSVFAADTGIEWELFNFYCGTDNPPRCTPPLPPPSGSFSSNKALYNVNCFDANNHQLASCADTASTSYAVATGTSLGTSRAFYLLITAATTTFP